MAKIYTFSVLYSTSEEFKDKVPYICAVLENEHGERFASLIEGFAPDIKIEIGQEVKQVGTDDQGNPRFSI